MTNTTKIQENKEQQTDLDKLNYLLHSLYQTIDSEFDRMKEFYTLVSSTHILMGLTETDKVKVSREIVDHGGKEHFANDNVEDYCEEIRVHLEKCYSNKDQKESS